MKEVVSLRTVYREAYSGHLLNTSAIDYVGPEVLSSAILDDDEKASIAANRRLTVIGDMEDRLRELGESVDELQAEVQKDLKARKLL